MRKGIYGTYTVYFILPQFGVLSDLIKRQDYSDALLDFLTKFKMEGIIGEMEGQYLYGHPYDKLAEIVSAKESSIDRLKEYLEKYWYIGHKSMEWYDLHKTEEKLYYGYWSFEAGAVAKILKLDDRELKDIQYYPYDLVHYHGC